MKNRIGFMQGRLSPLVDGRIQAFPWENWQNEFVLAKEYGFPLMEWTLDQERLYENPLLTSSGQAEIRKLCERYDLRILSLTGDCFMQAPFWKVDGDRCASLKKDFIAIAEACASVGISMILIPLVDNGRIENPEQEDILVNYLKSQIPFLATHKLKVVFESDFTPSELARFIGRLDSEFFGINYDIGNSASLGFDPNEEITGYGKRIINVHVKDRILGGTTVPLGTGNAKFELVFKALEKIKYTGNYILQTARATDSDHAKVLCRYRDMTIDWLTRYAA